MLPSHSTPAPFIGRLHFFYTHICAFDREKLVKVACSKHIMTDTFLIVAEESPVIAYSSTSKKVYMLTRLGHKEKKDHESK